MLFHQMQKKFNGILIHSKVFKDNDLLIKFLSDTDEVFSGIVYGGLSKNKGHARTWPSGKIYASLYWNGR